MGTYLTVKVVDKEQEVVERIHTLKGSVGSYIYAFDEESLTFEKGKYLYYKMPIEKAIDNLYEVKEDVLNNVIQEKLDDWSKENLQGKLMSLDEAIERLENYRSYERESPRL